MWSFLLSLLYTPKQITKMAIFNSVQSLSWVLLFVTPWSAARQASLSITKSRSLLKLMSIKSMMPSNHLILCHPLLLCLQYIPASGSFQSVVSSHHVAKVVEFQLQHQSFQWILRTYLLQDELVGSPCSPRDSHRSKLALQVKLIHAFKYANKRLLLVNRSREI